MGHNFKLFLLNQLTSPRCGTVFVPAQARRADTPSVSSGARKPRYRPLPQSKALIISVIAPLNAMGRRGYIRLPTDSAPLGPVKLNTRGDAVAILAYSTFDVWRGPRSASSGAALDAKRGGNIQAWLLWGLLFGSIGLGFFIYGKNQRAAVPLVCGVALMVFPYLVSNVMLLVGIGALLIAIPYFLRR